MSSTLPRIRVHSSGRFLASEEGAPFFWLGDTAWELFHRLTREEATLYFATRQRQHFNVIQAVVLAEFEGLTVPNAYGDLPLIDLDPTRPNEAYFQLVDEYIDQAAAHGLYVGLLPTWGDKVAKLWGAGPRVFTVENAHFYARWLGERYANRSNILWIVGGDRPPVYKSGDHPSASEESDDRPIWRAMAAGIRQGAGDDAFITYHPNGGKSTSSWLHEEEWIDMNMMQSGHGSGRDTPVWQMIERDYALQPAKPTLDGEPNYEDHPVNPWPAWNPNNGYFRDYDVRKQLYRSVFAGGCGVTYGHHAVWQFWEQGKREVVNHADRSWQEAIERPGANQVQHLRALMESRPYFSRIPDPTVLLSDSGLNTDHICATCANDGNYALIYIPSYQSVTLSPEALGNGKIRASWFNPRSGVSTPLGEFSLAAAPTFTTPIDGPDWVLIVDRIIVPVG